MGARRGLHSTRNAIRAAQPAVFRIVLVGAVEHRVGETEAEVPFGAGSDGLPRLPPNGYCWGMEKQRRAVEETVILKSGGKETRVVVRNGVVLLPKGFKAVSPRVQSRSRTAAKPATVNLAGLKEAPDYGPRAVTHRLINALGNNAVAALLGVNKDRPGRWESGQDSPNEENRAQLADLDALVGHLHSAFTPAQAKLWLEGQDPHLGARPIDVYRLEGAAPVLEAIRSYEQGAFA